jgi:hypothetical protein
MSELVALSLFLLSVAAVIASFTSVERRIISAIQTSKALFAEATSKKNLKKCTNKLLLINRLPKRILLVSPFYR